MYDFGAFGLYFSSDLTRFQPMASLQTFGDDKYFSRKKTMCFCWLLTSLELTAKAPENGWDWKTFSFPVSVPAQPGDGAFAVSLREGISFHGPKSYG